MKLTTFFTGSLLFAAGANAQYFSEGWKPGKPVPTSTKAAAAGFTPGSATSATDAKAQSTGLPPLKSLLDLFDITNILSWRPVADRLANAGLNVSATIERVTKIWDDRIPLIHDLNYDDIIVEEKLTEQEEKDRVWIIIITTASNGKEGLSKAADEVFDQAFDMTQKAGDLKHVRFGRIDYMNVTAITTRWMVWQAPYIVVLQDRGQTLRFYKTTNLRMKPEVMRKFLQEGAYQTTEPWTSIVGPGGEWEYVLNHFSFSMMRFHNFLQQWPQWMLYMVTGGIGTLILSVLHSPSKPAAKPKVKSDAATSTAAPAVNAGPEVKAGGSHKKKHHNKK